MNRREFAITAGTVGALASLPACFLNDVYKTIAQYIPFALLAFDRVVSILAEHGVNTSGLTEAIDRVKAALANIQIAVLEYRDALAAEKAAKLAAIRTALEIASRRLREFWEMLRIPNEQVAQTVKMLLDIIISTIEGFIMRLPAQMPGPLRPPEPKYGPVPQERSIKEFRHDFNRVLRARGESQFVI